MGSCVPADESDLAKSHKWEIAAWHRLDERVIEFDLYATGESFELFKSIVEQCREALK